METNSHYRQWLIEWCGDSGPVKVKCPSIMIVQLQESSIQEIARIDLPDNPKGDNGCGSFIRNRNSYGRTVEYLKLAHSESPGEEDKEGQVYWRSHGIFRQRFFMFKGTSNKKLSLRTDLTTEETCEFIETLVTRIRIVDNRINKILDADVKKRLEHLHLYIHEEKEEYENLIRHPVHFLVIHLSWFESLLKKNGVQEDTLIDELMKTCKILVLTTGRGRDELIKKIRKQAPGRVITAAPFLLQNAVIGGKAIRDDLDIKYGLCKVLFGS